MNEHSHRGTGKISVHGNGVGVPSPEQVEKRAQEIAMIDERNPNDFTEADWQEARKELMGVEGTAAPEADEDVVEEISERDEVMGESGHRVLREGFDEEETLGEQLVTDGIEEATSPDNQFFGVQRILDVVRSHTRNTAQEILQALENDVREFSHNQPQLDDMTVAVVKVNPTHPSN